MNIIIGITLAVTVTAAVTVFLYAAGRSFCQIVSVFINHF